MLRVATTFVFFTAVSAQSCAENPSHPECAARGSDLLQKNAGFKGGTQLNSSKLSSEVRQPGLFDQPRILWLHLHSYGGTTMCSLARANGEEAPSNPLQNCNIVPDWCSTPKSSRVSCRERADSHRFTFSAIERAVDEDDLKCSASGPTLQPGGTQLALKKQTELSYAHARKLRSRSKLLIEQGTTNDHREPVAMGGSSYVQLLNGKQLVAKHQAKSFRRDGTCLENAQEGFTHFMASSGLSEELSHAEVTAFEERFMEEMQVLCKHHATDTIPDHHAQAEQFVADLLEALREEMPVLSERLFHLLENEAQGVGRWRRPVEEGAWKMGRWLRMVDGEWRQHGAGRHPRGVPPPPIPSPPQASYTLEFADWLANFSAADLRRRTGITHTDETARKGQRSWGVNVSMLQTSAITDNIMVRDLPSSFESADEWPMCSEIIMRIHNQGGRLGPRTTGSLMEV
eukprot:Skav211791  [mRNA]  locus=scaffold305:226975:238866:+ [translate_table: standard]